jgi:phosphotransferase family enzyme
MALTDSRVALDVLKAFGLMDSTLGLSAQAGGHINESWLVTTPDGRYLLQRLNPAVFPAPREVMANIERVTGYLKRAVRAAGLPDPDRRVLSLCPAAGGTSAVTGPDGSLWRLYDYIAGVRALERVSGLADAREIGRGYGAFHRLLADYDGPPLVETLPGFHDTAARLGQLEQAVLLDPLGRLAEVPDLLDLARARVGLARLLLPLMAAGAVPRRIAHNDAKCSNVLLDSQSGEAMAVVDLDTVMPGTLLHDFGDLVRSVTSPTDEDSRDLSNVGVRVPLFTALARGFLEQVGRRLTPTEREHLVAAGEVITYEQGVRFLTDHLRGDVYYRTTRPGQNLDRARTQFRLLETLEAARDELEDTVRSEM